MVHFNIHPKEQRYFALRAFFATIAILAIVSMLAFIITVSNPMIATFIGPAFFYIILILSALYIRRLVLVGLIKANSVKLSKTQFPEVYAVVEDFANRLELKNIPNIYLLESGGILNAFATRLMRQNYVVIYSELLEEFYDGDKSIVEFVIAHELGHIKRNHIGKEMFLMFSFYIPFLSNAYYRACEYTCDNVGCALSPQGAPKGILAIASGRSLYKKMNPQAFDEQYDQDQSFWRWLVSKFSTHPMMMLRYRNIIQNINVSKISKPIVEQQAAKEYDHSQFMPK